MDTGLVGCAEVVAIPLVVVALRIIVAQVEEAVVEGAVAVDLITGRSGKDTDPRTVGVRLVAVDVVVV